MNKNPAPIALFVYNRPDHTRQTVEALRKNGLASASDLIIFSDGPRDQTAERAVAEVRSYIRSISGFKSVRIVERSENFGLSRSIISGVSEIMASHGRAIVLEDDLVTSPYFLEYMNDALDEYESDARVGSVHGYIYPVKKPLPETFFLRGADCWGWATWKRAWDTFEADGAKLLHALETRGLMRGFDLEGAFGYSSMLKRQVAGLTDSWAIRWHASAYLSSMLTLYPGTSLVDNIGQDSSGTHKGAASYKYESLEARKIRVGGIPVEENVVARAVVIDYFKSRRPSLARRAKSALKTMLKKLFRGRAKYGFFGDYRTWAEARSGSRGYDEGAILEKVRASLLKVKRGEAVYERDSMLFNEIQYSQPVLDALLSSAAENGGKLHIVDFGGSLGSSYFQNKGKLGHLKELRWHIVEQPGFVAAGKKDFEDDCLKFFPTIEAALQGMAPQFLLFSSSIQYIDDYRSILEKACSSGFRCIAFDRTPFWNEPDRITVQKVSPRIYDASYPARILNIDSFKAFFEERGYAVSAEYSCGSMSYDGQAGGVALKGFRFTK